jgi:hypothetical protein
MPRPRLTANGSATVDPSNILLHLNIGHPARLFVTNKRIAVNFAKLPELHGKT